MRQYIFDTLNSTDLEHLVRDLLNADEKANKTAITYSSFPGWCKPFNRFIHIHGLRMPCLFSQKILYFNSKIYH